MATSTTHSRPPQSASACPPGTGTLTTIDGGNQPPDSSRGEGRRRTSFSFLRRGKSVDPMPSSSSTTKRSGSTKLHKKGRDRAMSSSQEPEPINATPPVLPAPVRQPQIETFGGEDAVARKTASVSPSNEAIVMGLAARARRHDSQLSEMSQPIDPYARTESMTHRGRYSYASSTISTINHPRKMRRRKDPTWFNILVVGAKDSGKTSFVNFLRSSLLSQPRKSKSNAHDSMHDVPDGYNRATSSFTPHYLETDVSDGEKLGITIWDSAPLDRNLIDIQLREVTSFVESKFEETFTEEQRIVRSPGVRDTHIHCAFLVLDPANLDRNMAAARKALERYAGGASNGRPVLGPTTILDAGIDFEILNALQGKTTVVPVISKADTVTTTHMAELKRTVFEALKAAGLSPFEAIRRNDDDDEDDDDEAGHSRGAHRRHDSKFFDERDEETLDRRLAEANLDPSRPSPARSSGKRPLSAVFPADTSAETDDSELQVPYLPLSIISPEVAAPHLPGVKGVVGRQFPWGFADPYDEAHCDFGKLKQAVFCEWRDDIRIASRELWYESWRESRLRMPNKPGRASAQELPTHRSSPRPPHSQQMPVSQQPRQASAQSSNTVRTSPRQNLPQQYQNNYPYPAPPNAQNNPGAVGIAVSSAEDLHRHRQQMQMQSQARYQRRPQEEVGVAR